MTPKPGTISTSFGLCASLAALQTYLPFDAQDARPCATIQTRIVAPIPEAGANFGQSVALVDDTLLVGEPNRDAAGVDSGIVHVFRRAAVGYVHEAALLPADVDADHRFGWSLAAHPGTPSRVVVGSWGDGGVAPRRGSAYVFERTPGGWVEAAKLDPPPRATGIVGFGWSVELEGDVAIVGSPFENGIEGAAYVFARSAEGVWNRTHRLASPNPYGGEVFGMSVSLSGDRLAVGAPYFGLSYVIGRAYVFARTAGAWSSEASLIGFPVGRDRFGSSVALSDDLLVVGSPRDSVPPWGLAFVFHRSTSVPEWRTVNSFLAPEPDVTDAFGLRVVVNEGQLAVAAAGARGHGEVNVYRLTAAGETTLRCTFAPTDGDVSDFFGAGLALEADTLAVGAPEHDAGAHDAGAVYVFEM